MSDEDIDDLWPNVLMKQSVSILLPWDIDSDSDLFWLECWLCSHTYAFSVLTN